MLLRKTIDRKCLKLSSLCWQKPLAGSILSEWVDGSDMRCFFHLVSNHDEIVDDTGIEVDNLESAKAQALLAIDELRKELGEEVQDWSGWRLNIVCPLGTILYTTPLTETFH